MDNIHAKRWLLASLSGIAIAAIILLLSSSYSSESAKAIGDNVEPDTTQPFWYTRYLNEDAAKPRFDQVVNGIRVGPTVAYDGAPPCAPGAATLVGAAEANGTPLETPFQPGRGTLQRDDTIACNGALVAHELEYYTAPDPNLDANLRSGRARWETSAHGTALSIYRSLTSAPAWNCGIAADRWYAGSIKGMPAAIARPAHDIGLGVSTIVIWDPKAGVQTTLVATNMTIGQLTAFAEALYR